MLFWHLYQIDTFNNNLNDEDILTFTQPEFFLCVAYQRGTSVPHDFLHFFVYKKKNIWENVIACTLYSLIDSFLPLFVLLFPDRWTIRS